MHATRALEEDAAVGWDRGGGPETPLFWSTWGRRAVGKTRAPMTGKNIWRLCKVYGRLIGYPELKPHDLRHGVAMEVLEQHHDLEEVRALLGHARIDTTRSTPSSSAPKPRRSRSSSGGPDDTEFVTPLAVDPTR